MKTAALQKFLMVTPLQTGQPTKQQTTTPHDGIAGSEIGDTVKLSVQLTVFPYPDFKWVASHSWFSG